MRLNVLVGDALGGEVAQVDLALLGLGLLAGDLLALDDVGLLGGGSLDAGAVLEQDEGEPSRSPGVGVSLQIDVLDLAKLAEILLDVCVFRLLKIFHVLEKISKISKHLVWQQFAIWRVRVFQWFPIYLGKTSNKQLPVILVDWVLFSCHFGCFCGVSKLKIGNY